MQGGLVDEGQVYCREIESMGAIGVQSVIDAGVIHAVDVFALHADGWAMFTFNAPLAICLQGEGRLVYLDVNQSPRVPQWLDTIVDAGYSCGQIPNPGTVVLAAGGG